MICVCAALLDCFEGPVCNPNWGQLRNASYHVRPRTDSAGIAISNEGEVSSSAAKITLQSSAPHEDFADLAADVAAATGMDDSKVSLAVKDTHAVRWCRRAWLPMSARRWAKSGRLCGSWALAEPRDLQSRAATICCRAIFGITDERDTGRPYARQPSLQSQRWAHPFPREPINACIMAHCPITTVCGAS